MLGKFNNVFSSLIRENQEHKKQRIMEFRAQAFFPGGIATRKKYFTPNELVDIYIKGNGHLYQQLKDNGFGDEDFERNKDEWRHAVVSADKYYGSPQDLWEHQKAFSMLVGEFLDIDRAVAKFGYAAFSNGVIFDFADLIPFFETLVGNRNLFLYYRFFKQFENLRQYNLDLALTCNQPINMTKTYVEEKAACLERIQRTKDNLKTIVLQIEGCNRIAEKLDERTEENG